MSVGGTILQIAGLLAGFLLVRWLTVEQFAQYSVAFGFGSTLSLLVDLGLTGGLIALIGQRTHDKETVGRYVDAGRRLRTWSLSLIALPSIAVFGVIASRQGWDLVLTLLLGSGVVVWIAARAGNDLYSVGPLITQHFQPFFWPQVMGSVGRLAVQTMLWAVGALTGWLAMLLNSLAMAVTAWAYRRRRTDTMTPLSASDPHAFAELVHYVKPLLPVSVFIAFQSQITIMVSALVGQTRTIAEVGALSRLSFVYVVPGMLNYGLISPLFARQPRERLRTVYLAVTGSATALIAVVSLAAFLIPAPFLLLLGHDYSGLTKELGWYMLGAGLAYLAAVLYTANAARKFVYWWNSLLGIVLILAAQVVGAFVFDVTSTLGLQYFLVAGAATEVFANAIGSLYGLRHGPRELKPEAPTESA